MSNASLIRADLALCPSGKLLRDAWLVAENGTIKAIGEGEVPSAYSGLRQRGGGDLILLPGFVNPHCHLMLTDLVGCIPPTRDFWQWIFDLMVVVGEMTDSDIERSTANGLRLSLEAGTTTLLDFARSGTRHADSPIRTVWADELIAFDEKSTRERLASIAGDGPLIAAPHAIYSTTSSLLRALAKERERRGGLLTIHLAEILDESDFTLMGESPGLRRYDEHFGVARSERPPGGQTPTKYLDSLGMLGPQTLLVHGNCLTCDDIELVAERGSPLCHCATTHQYFSRLPFPMAEMIDRGMKIVLGTDSLASGPTLSMWEQARLVASQFSALTWQELLQMITSGPARAIDLDEKHGTLSEGAVADLLLVESEVSIAEAQSNPWRLFDHSLRICEVIRGGN